MKTKPKEPAKGFLAWMKSTYFYDEDHLIQTAGLDSATYLRVLTFGQEVFMWVTLWCLVTVWPVNLSVRRHSIIGGGGSVLNLNVQWSIYKQFTGIKTPISFLLLVLVTQH